MTINETNIIITGAASGFGKAMAEYFFEKGAGIFAVDANKAGLDKLKTDNPGIETIICDITDNILVESAVSEIFALNPGINVLINNAGIMKTMPLINILSRPDRRHSLDTWQKVIEVNQTAVFYTTRSVADKMIQNRTKGLIINISSIAAQGNVGQTAYSASKAAVEAMTRVWAKELGHFGIRSVAIAPGFMDTAGTHNALEEKMLRQWVEKTPLKRTGTVHEVVTAVSFVIENEFVNGEVLRINGGLTI